MTRETSLLDIPRPLYSGAPDIGWVPSSRVAPLGSATRPLERSGGLRHLLVRQAALWKSRHAIKLARGGGLIILPRRAASLRQNQLMSRLQAAPVETFAPTSAPALEEALTLEHEISPAEELAAIAAEHPASEPEPSDREPVAEAPVEPEPEVSAPAPREADEPEMLAPSALEHAAPASEAPAFEELPPSAIAPETAERIASVPAAPGVTPDWDVLILSGPAGTGKSSVARAIGGRLVKAIHVRVEPMRDKAFRSVSAWILPPAGSQAGAVGIPAQWSGEADEARQRAADLAIEHVGEGYQIILEDVIEAPAELQPYLDALGSLKVQTVTLMPSVEELQRRDAIRPGAERGPRPTETRQAMVKALSEVSHVLDTKDETVDETADRVLGTLT